MFQLGEERIATCSSCFNGMVFGVPSWLNRNKSLVLMSQQSSIGLMRVVTARFALVFFYGNQCKAC